jgi:secreted trypsin-like serine protease
MAGTPNSFMICARKLAPFIPALLIGVTIVLAAGSPAGASATTETGLSEAPAGEERFGGDRWTRIIGGTEALPGSWPSQAALLASSQPDPNLAQFCGGTLIDPDWVLTAAHCVDFLASPSQLNVAIGINDLNAVNPGDRKSISEIVIHPDWDDESFEWDFALLRLQTGSAQPTTDLITPAEAGETVGGKPARIAGWGCTLQVLKADCGTSGGYPSELREAEVQFVADSDCGSGTSYGSSFKPVMMICAGIYPAGGKDTCFGDSGGPVTASVDGRAVLAGITSWGKEPCGIPNYPGVFARVTSGLDWIYETMGLEPGGEITPASRDFGSRRVTAGPSATTAFTLTSSGTAPLTVLSGGVRLSGTNPRQFFIKGGTCRRDGTESLPAGDSCTVQVGFDPTTAGKKSARLAIATSAGPVTADLSGTGTAAKFSKVRLYPRKKTIRSGNRLKMKVKVTNTGTAPGWATVRLRSKVPSKVKVPSRIKVQVPAGTTRGKAFKVRTVRCKKGKVRVVARVGDRKSASILRLKCR